MHFKCAVPLSEEYCESEEIKLLQRTEQGVQLNGRHPEDRPLLMVHPVPCAGIDDVNGSLAGPIMHYDRQGAGARA